MRKREWEGGREGGREGAREGGGRGTKTADNKLEIRKEWRDTRILCAYAYLNQ